MRLLLGYQKWEYLRADLAKYFSEIIFCFTFICLFIYCVYVFGAGGIVLPYATVKWYPTGVGYHLQSCRSLGMNPGYWAYWLAEPTCQRLFLLEKKYIHIYICIFIIYVYSFIGCQRMETVHCSFVGQCCVSQHTLLLFGEPVPHYPNSERPLGLQKPLSTEDKTRMQIKSDGIYPGNLSTIVLNLDSTLKSHCLLEKNGQYLKWVLGAVLPDF